MQDHELRVKHIVSGKELIVSKKYYHDSPDEYELLDGEAGEANEPAVFVPATPPAKVEKVKQDSGPAKNKAAPPVPAPSV